jgi:gamma-glutamyltranspeptidase/glutathione hydrolase
MSRKFGWNFSYPSRRMPVLANNIVATSHPLASQAGLRMLLKGGNAVDAILASAITLTVVEPTMNGIGSDAFTILWDGKKIVGLNASGKSPAAWTPEHFSQYKTMPTIGWDTVTVPGAVSSWVELWKKYGQLNFKELFEPAIKYARHGYLVSPITSQVWNVMKGFYKKSSVADKQVLTQLADSFLINGKAPKPGQLFKFPAQAQTLELIAETEGEAFYHGELAKKIVNHAKQTGGLISLEDLENHKPMWEKTLTMDYKGIILHELPPNGQGLIALIMLGILKKFDISSFQSDSAESIHLQLEAMKLAFADGHRYISDPDYLKFDTKYFLDHDYLSERANLIDLNHAKDPKHGKPRHGGTVYLTAADEEGMMVSFIQSNYSGFGSGIVIPETGISLQNRGSGFTLEEGHPNQVGPNKRPFHTIIPAFVTKKGEPLISFGVMGGPMQPQGHVQMMIRIFEYRQNPQAALDAPRWQVMEGIKVRLEAGFEKNTIETLIQKGHNVSEGHFMEFGGSQLIYRLEDGYLGASDPRKDGQAVGF